MHTYETLFITPPNLTEEEENSTVEVMAQIVTAGGGTFIANDRMGRRRLAYPIRKFDDGVYMRFLYDSEAAVPKELERRFRLSDKILRALTVRLEDDWAVASKEEAVRDAERRERAEADRVEAERVEADRVAAAAAAPTEEEATPDHASEPESEPVAVEPTADETVEATAEPEKTED